MSLSEETWFGGGQAFGLGQSGNVISPKVARVWAGTAPANMSLELADATTIPTGGPIYYILNTGLTFDVTILFNGGTPLNAIIVLGPQEGAAFLLLDNSTAAGVWRTMLFAVDAVALVDPEIGFAVFPGGATDPAGVVEYDPRVDVWTVGTMNPNTSGHQEGHGFSSGALAFVLGSSAPSAEMDEWDRQLDTWTARLDMPGRNYAACGDVVSGLGYAQGGLPVPGGLSRNDEYTLPSPESWAVRTDIPVNRAFGAGAGAFASVWLLGGSTDATFPNGTRTMLQYSPGLDTWDSGKSDVPYPKRVEHDLVTIVESGTSFMYSFCGNRDDGTAATSTADADRYDGVNDVWERRTDFPAVARLGAGTCNVDSKAYLAGGRTQVSSGDQSDAYSYYPLIDTWVRETDLSAASSLWDNQAVGTA